MENQERPVWMTDPLVKDIPEKKLKFVEQLFAKGRGKSQKEMMAYLMPMMNVINNLTYVLIAIASGVMALTRSRYSWEKGFFTPSIRVGFSSIRREAL